jgi:membrane protease YdiL (CAAX protease family)
MTPIDDITPIPDPHPSPPSSPFFDYADLFLFAGVSVPCLLVAALLVRVAAAPFHTSMAFRGLLAQTVWYFLSFGALAVLFRIRYAEPLWRSLGWRPIPFGAAVGAILAGPLLAVTLGLLGSALRTPEIDLPFEEMLGSRGTIIFLGILVVVLGPVAEELAFRGFLMPLLSRSLGLATGIVTTGILFGCLHGREYEWSWRHMLLISVAGCIFGWAKYKTKSTAASAFMHSTFNLTQFAAFLVQQRSL